MTATIEKRGKLNLTVKVKAVVVRKKARPRKPKPPKPDVHVGGSGTVYLVTPLTKRAKDWVGENVPLDSWQWSGSGFGVEHRYIDNLVEGMRNDGLLVVGG